VNTFSKNIEFSVPLPMLFETFFDPGRLSALAGSPCMIEKKVGGKIALFGDQVEGQVVELKDKESFVWKWRFKGWPEGHFSKVSMQFKADGGSTILSLQHKDIPSHDYQRTTEGWERFFWSAMKRIFGWAYRYSKKNK